MKSIDEYTREPAEMLLDMAGEDVTLVTQVVDYYDDYNDPVYTENRISTKAEIVVRGTPQFERRLDGVDSDVTAVAFVMDEHRDVIHTGDESDTDGPTTLETETHQYTIHNWFDENNGKLRLHLV